MAATNIGLRDWLLGWIIPNPKAGGTGTVGIQAHVLTDSTGAEYNAANPLPVSSGGSGTGNVNLAQVAGTTTAAGNGATTAGTQRVTLSTDGTGQINVVPKAVAGNGASFLNIVAGQATTTVKSGAGTLYAIILNSAASATNVTTVFDNTAGSGTIIGKPAATTATLPTTLNYGPTGLAFATGLTILTATANGSDMTVVYK